MASSSNPVDATPPWLELPREVTAMILHKLGVIEILMSAQKVCTTWRSVCQDPSMWRCIDMGYAGDMWDVPDDDLEEMCRHAVDRSQGQLIEIKIENCVDDDLLLYISQRSPQLKCLQVVQSYITGEAVRESVKKFPKLEELHIYYTSISAETIETVGQSCPNLKSFKFNNRWYENPHRIGSDLEALAIAASMPQLNHLQLFGNKMTNEGLQAILDGCPNLRSLDIRWCFNVHLCGNLGRLCSQRIKDLRRPHDPTDDYRFNDRWTIWFTSFSQQTTERLNQQSIDLREFRQDVRRSFTELRVQISDLKKSISEQLAQMMLCKKTKGRHSRYVPMSAEEVTAGDDEEDEEEDDNEGDHPEEDRQEIEEQMLEQPYEAGGFDPQQAPYIHDPPGADETTFQQGFPDYQTQHQAGPSQWDRLREDAWNRYQQTELDTQSQWQTDRWTIWGDRFTSFSQQITEQLNQRSAELREFTQEVRLNHTELRNLISDLKKSISEQLEGRHSRCVPMSAEEVIAEDEEEDEEEDDNEGDHPDEDRQEIEEQMLEQLYEAGGFDPQQAPYIPDPPGADEITLQQGFPDYQTQHQAGPSQWDRLSEDTWNRYQQTESDTQSLWQTDRWTIWGDRFTSFSQQITEQLNQQSTELREFRQEVRRNHTELRDRISDLEKFISEQLASYVSRLGMPA